MKTNALKVRNNFGKIIEDLRKKKEPIIIERGRVPVAVLISLEDYQARFIDKLEDEKRQKLLKKVHDLKIKSISDSTEELRRLRYG